MSTISFLSPDSSVASEQLIYPSIQSMQCVSPFQETNEDSLPTSLTKSDNSNLLHNDHKSSQEFLSRLCYQKSKLIRLYNTEIQRRQSTSHLITFLNKVDQLLNEYENHESINDTTTAPKHLDSIYSTYFSDNSSLNYSNDVDVNESLNEQNEKNENINNCTDDHSYARTSKFPKKLTINQLKRFKYNGCCPLTTRTYGLDPAKHGIRLFPCTRVTAPISLYKHLTQYHQLTHSPSMKIVRLLADENEEDDIDLFSSESTSLIATHPTVYRAQCPLNEYGKFGIRPEHKIRLCTQPNQPLGAPLVPPKDVCLYDHFVVYHQMKRSCAQRLAEAIVRNKTEPVFHPDEQLLNDAFYIECPLRHPKAICWNSPISTRHMGQHLTGIHKLNRTARHQVMKTLRKQRS